MALPTLQTGKQHRDLRYKTHRRTTSKISYGHPGRGPNFLYLIFQGKVERKRPRSRSHNRWSDQVSKQLKMPNSAALNRATERNHRRQLVDLFKA